MKKTFNFSSLDGTINAAIFAAIRYHELTGKPLGITGEVGEVIAAKLLKLNLAEALQAGYDATGEDDRLVQIKSVCVPHNSNPGHRVGSIRLDHQWDTVVLILMTIKYEPIEIWEADRSDVERELLKPGSKARNVRGALSVAKFKSIAALKWSSETDLELK